MPFYSHFNSLIDSFIDEFCHNWPFEVIYDLDVSQVKIEFDTPNISKF